jgi:EAL domain-containing protein (putative c-di-GMP-specific phosphodiesterase class I)
MSASQPTNGDPGFDWYLEGFTDERSVLRRILIRPLPFRVGRNPGMDFVLPHSNVSKYHAEVTCDDQGLILNDLGSTNGTFINNVAISAPTRLQAGDIICFASYEFCLLRSPLTEPEILTSTIRYNSQTPARMLARVAEFRAMMSTAAVRPVFQPVIRLGDGECIGHEMLGRGAREGLTRMPRELFEIAAGLRCEAQLSRLFRETGSVVCRDLAPGVEVFLNVHPTEMKEPKALLTSVAEVCRQNPERRFTVEICEVAVTDVAEMSMLRNELSAMGVGVAYDDFGSGQARLVELVEVPPDYLKFDIGLVQDLHKAPGTKQHMVEMLVRFADDQGIRTIAEGIETAEEAEICRQLRFHAAQGFYYGRPCGVGEDSQPTTVLG